jgi:site-specific DNA-methyltransferase (adenine-specific)
MPDQAIIVNKEHDIEYSGFRLHKAGISAIGNPSFEQWEECGAFIKKAEGAVHLWLGDWINYGEVHYDGKYSQALDATELDYGTLRNAAYVAKNVDLSRRRDNLSFSHHQEVAPLEPALQEKYLDLAEDKQWTRKELRKAIRQERLEEQRQIRPAITLDKKIILGDAVVELQKLANESVDCLITDPPYGIDYSSNRREVNEDLGGIVNDQESAFELLDDVMAVVEKKLKPNSHLYIFTSWKVYPQFERIISKYFEIKNVLVWDKENHGSGDLDSNYGEQYELIIFATNGRRFLNGTRPSNILRYGKVYLQKHPTQKPTDLLEALIDKSTKEGELVVDPFMGSGSTCKAAKNMGRTYLGIELDERWYKLAQEVINEK